MATSQILLCLSITTNSSCNVNDNFSLNQASSGKSIKANAESKNFRYQNKNQVIKDDIIKIKQNEYFIVIFFNKESYHFCKMNKIM